MRSGHVNMGRARRAALVMGAGVLGSLALAGPSVAAAPNAGVACQAADGKISGRGATFQTKALQALIDGYRVDVCGPVASDPVALTNMIAYNYPAAAGGAGTGSGAGQKATSCRTDAFGGSDIPYDQATLAGFNGAPGALGGCAITFSPPFQPGPAPYPGATDVAANVMSFPVAGSSVAVAVNLSAAACGGTRPTALSFSTSSMSKLASGDIAMWNDPQLVAENASLAPCNKAVTRVVRLDKSGTTQVYKNYYKNADGTRALCDGSNWTDLALDANNTVWPTGAGCSALVRPTTNGGGAVIAHTRTVDGGFGYADLADAVVAGTPPLVLAQLRNATDTAYTSPAAGVGANCDFTTTLPGSTNGDAVGLNAGGDNWAIDSTSQHSDVTFRGTAYPICGLTFDFVYTGLNGNSGANNAITRLTANQRRTLYSFFTYVFSPAGQSRLAAARYAALPAGFLTKLRLGYQSSF